MRGIIALTEIREQLVDTEYEPPEGPVEVVVARILTEVLDIDRVGRSDSFYDFGGTSIQAVRACARIERATGQMVSPSWLFDTENLSEFVACMLNASSTAKPVSPIRGELSAEIEY